MENDNNYIDRTSPNQNKNEEYFLVETEKGDILTKIEYGESGGDCLSFIDGKWIYNYIGITRIQRDGFVVSKEQFEEKMNEYDNVVKTKNNIRNNLEYIISLEKTEKKFFNLLEKHKNLDKEKIIKALDLAKKFHNGITRDEGTPYIVHTISVAIYAMEDGVDTDTVIVCLLHDILEDTDISEEEIRELFGENVVNLVKKLSKEIKHEKKDLNIYYSEILLDKVALKIKGFDRLNNVYSLFLQPDTNKITKYIQKTEKDILPLLQGKQSEIYNNIVSILEILKTDQEISKEYKEKLKDIQTIQEKKQTL